VNGTSILLLGLGLGLRHASDADHVAVLSTLIQREPGPFRAARIAALWGAGHSVSFLTVGLLVIVAGVHVTPQFERLAESLIAAMLIGFGLWHLSRQLTGGVVADQTAASRPVFIGIVHGLAGSGGVALLAMAAIESRLWAVAYLGLFGVGTLFGMMMLTVVLSWVIAWSVSRQGLAQRVIAVVPALLSLSLGLYFVAENWL
jgi:sulfite exporter TauE/SafE